MGIATVWLLVKIMGRGGTMMMMLVMMLSLIMTAINLMEQSVVTIVRNSPIMNVVTNAVIRLLKNTHWCTTNAA